MEGEHEWQNVERKDPWDIKEAGVALLRFGLLFGVCAIALLALTTPSLKDERSASRDFDPMPVGSIIKNGR